MDEKRKLILRHDGHTTEKEEKQKIFVYSAFRVCIIDQEQGQLRSSTANAKHCLIKKSQSNERDKHFSKPNVFDAGQLF